MLDLQNTYLINSSFYLDRIVLQFSSELAANELDQRNWKVEINGEIFDAASVVRDPGTSTWNTLYTDLKTWNNVLKIYVEGINFKTSDSVKVIYTPSDDTSKNLQFTAGNLSTGAPLYVTDVWEAEIASNPFYGHDVIAMVDVTTGIVLNCAVGNGYLELERLVLPYPQLENGDNLNSSSGPGGTQYWLGGGYSSNVYYHQNQPTYWFPALLVPAKYENTVGAGAVASKYWMGGTVDIALFQIIQNYYEKSTELSLFLASAASTLSGGSSSDLIYSQDDDANNTINAGSGDDTILSDLFFSKEIGGKDNIIAGDGNDLVYAGGGDDVITSGNGNDEVDAGAGNDLIVGGDGAGDDKYFGGSGTDTLKYTSAKAAIAVNLAVGMATSRAGGDAAGIGTDTLSQIENIIAGNYDDLLTGDDSANNISGLSGNDSIIGGDGDDALIGGKNNDILDGGLGTDTAVFSGRFSDYIVTYDPVTQIFTITDKVSARDGIDTTNSIENFQFSDDTKSAASLVPIVIDGSSDNDILDGSVNSELINGLAGNDTIKGLGGKDTIDGGEGYDTADYSDKIHSVVVALNGSTAVSVRVNRVVEDSIKNIENLIGGSAADTFTGDANNNTLDGRAGADRMAGGLGDDTYIVDNTLDRITELTNSGTDEVNSSVSLSLQANVENLTLTGSSNINATGNALGNILTGNSGANLVDGKTGADTMIGGGDNDTYIVDNIGDVIIEDENEGTDSVQSTVSYTLSNHIENLTLTGKAAINGTGNNQDNRLTGNTAANTLSGGQGSDTLDGGSGNDTLLGGDGDDVLIGGLGNDLLTGGDHADKFRFSTALGKTNVGTITDFATGIDRIELDDAIFKKFKGVTGQIAEGNFVKGSAGVKALDSNDRLIFNTDTGALFYDADGNGSGAAIQFATLTGVSNIAYTDFWIV